MQAFSLFGIGKKRSSLEENLSSSLQLERLPRHIAIIMDGNGRWAKKRGLPRGMGHRAGVDALREVVRACVDLGIKVLTVYAFSTENWKRPPQEVDLLMNLLSEYLEREREELQRNGIQVRTIGRIEELPAQAQSRLQRLVEATAANEKLILVLALNYGGRAEIVCAASRLAREVREGRFNPEDVDEEAFASFLDTAGLPDPDLLIRPSGELRLSNFLLWQTAYAEFFSTEVNWPDFRRSHLLQALLDYQQRERRYGGIT